MGSDTRGLCPNTCNGVFLLEQEKRPEQNLPYKMKRDIYDLIWKNRLGSLSSVTGASLGWAKGSLSCWTQNAIDFSCMKISPSILKLFLPHLYSQPFLYATVMAFRQINILHASQGCHTLFSIFPLVSAPVKHGNKVISLTCLASKIDFGIHLLIIGRFANSK